MSSIFNLFGEIAESDRGHIMKSIVQSETSHNIKLNSLKTMGGTKPKKLKMRSNSDMNLSHSTHSINIKKNTNGNKELDCLKLKVTQTDNNGCPISPGKEKKKLIAQSPKFKESALKETTVIDKSPKAQLNEDIFKKPLSYKKNIKQFPKPEKLAYWYDDQYKFDYGYIEAIEKEFKDLLSKEKENIKPSEEKELISETPMLLEVPKLVFDDSFDEEHKKFSSCDLPEISDISDDDTLQ
ncbi:uncharacterized protein LOC105253241 [Camponotus floridanus]|uniref:uncharacterized protein LOC105253241 n=1 Tax=Camponotus floridanus TaxID=104421 RepID=UPI00059DBD42|nr:uncharacterized protein LOC105253241 [Camponotus floridanus]